MFLILILFVALLSFFNVFNFNFVASQWTGGGVYESFPSYLQLCQLTCTTTKQVLKKKKRKQKVEKKEGNKKEQKRKKRKTRTEKNEERKKMKANSNFAKQ